MSAIIKQNFKLPLYLIRIASVNTCESLSNSIQMIRFLHGMQKSHDLPSIVDMVVCCLYEVGHIIYQHDSKNRHLSLLRRLQKKMWHQHYILVYPTNAMFFPSTSSRRGKIIFFIMLKTMNYYINI
jgi:hypothetical protein